MTDAEIKQNIHRAIVTHCQVGNKVAGEVVHTIMNLITPISKRREIMATTELAYEPAPNSQADLDYQQWQSYLIECTKTKTKPSLSDFLVYLDDHDVNPAT